MVTVQGVGGDSAKLPAQRGPRRVSNSQNTLEPPEPSITRTVVHTAIVVCLCLSRRISFFICRHDSQTGHEAHLPPLLPGKSIMKKSGRTIPNTVEYKPPKRKKSTDGPVQYSDRWVDWEEQKRLGKKFREVGKGSWPAADILDERYSGKKREYLVSWEPHPETKEIFRPTWVWTDLQDRRKRECSLTSLTGRSR